MNKREAAKARTRAKALKAARAAFSTTDYHAVTIRALAKSMRMTTGAIFANFTGKEDLYRQAMGMEPPLDGPLTRAAPLLLSFARRIESAMLHTPRDELDITRIRHDARFVIELATHPLDGEAWASHLSATSGVRPHIEPEQPASPPPSGGAGDGGLS